MWERLNEWLVRLDVSNEKIAETELLIILDADRKEFKFYSKVFEDLKFLPNYYKLNAIRLVWTEQQPLDDQDRVHMRRKRIMALRELVKTFTSDSRYFFQWEDDTIPPDFAFKRLLKDIRDLKAGFVQGIERGRWQSRYAGAWKTDNIEDPQYFESLPMSKGMTEIHGGGAYCFICPTPLMKQMKFRDEESCLGPDVNFVLDICRAGYKCYTDWDVKCDHFVKDKPEPIKVEDIEVVKFRKVKGEFRQIYE
jgi:hypothetical protein